MPFKVVRNDLTKMQVDAIVNTANAAPVYSSGTDSAVYKAAGMIKLLYARKKIGYMEEGEAAITPGFKLPAKYIIHAVSPCYIDGNCGEEEKLRSCYQKSLLLAKEYGCESIAFPLIATGNLGYPKEEGMRIAVDEITAFLMQNEMLVYLVVFDPDSTRLGRKLYPDLESYIDHNYVNKAQEDEYGQPCFESTVCFNRCSDPIVEEKMMRPTAPSPQPSISPKRSADLRESTVSKKRAEPRASTVPEKSTVPRESTVPKKSTESRRSIVPKKSAVPKQSARGEQKNSDYEENFIEDYYDFVEEQESALKERMRHMADTFQEYLLYLIEIKGLSNAEVYKRAIVTKQLFSKIKLNPDYHPDKATAMRLCVGAKLNLDETKDLLARAGYALSPCDKRDIIFSFFIEREIYDMIELDIVLEEHDLPCFIE